MAIPQFVTDNFNTLIETANAGHLALMDCRDARTDEPRYVICAVGHDGNEYTFTPFGHLHSEGNPFDAYIPPEN